MKWTENGHECELRLVLNGGEWEGPHGREVLPRDIIAALRANPEACVEVLTALDDLSPQRALAESLDARLRLDRDCAALRARALAAERERDEAVAMLKEAEDALLEAQTERDSLQERLDVYEPPYKPRKYV